MVIVMLVNIVDGGSWARRRGHFERCRLHPYYGRKKRYTPSLVVNYLSKISHAAEELRIFTPYCTLGCIL